LLSLLSPSPSSLKQLALFGFLTGCKTGKGI
jgi:hypothetical protein